MLMLLDHLILRVDNEGPVLDQDNREMKQTFGYVTEWLKKSQLGGTLPEIKNLITDIESILNEQDNLKHHVPAISVLQEKNTALKKLFLHLIKTVEGCRDNMPAEIFDQLKEKTDNLLRQQLERDFQWIEPAFVGKPHI
jgi:hypothetical protein